MRFASLGSGSEGNALLVQTLASLVMLDCGFGVRETEQRLARLGCCPEDLDAVVITHEHSDHIGSAYSFTSRYRLPLYMTYGTYCATQGQLAKRKQKAPDIHFCRADQTFTVGDLALLPFTVPHDAREPVQFVFQTETCRMAALTDVGMPTPYLIERLQTLQALVLECNHDSDMLAQSSYPASLKIRIGGNYGHLANHAAAYILEQLTHTKLELVVAAHLSQQNNCEKRVLEQLRRVYQGAIHIACQNQGFDWFTVNQKNIASAPSCTATVSKPDYSVAALP